MSSTRQLAAIMFTDIVGYTTLMGRDEGAAFVLLEENRQMQKPIIESHGGRWIKEIGDGILASFQSASDAVKAAIAIQTECRAKHKFKLRIGIHLGEVVFEKEDVFGDGVNIAARIQALALPGAILISESVHSNVSNKKDIQTEYLRTATLKNVNDPVRIYQIKKDGVLAFETPGSEDRSLAGKLRSKYKIVAAALLAVVIIASVFFIYQHFVTSENRDLSAGSMDRVEKSIAVLPFVNMSSDTEQEYFSDGLSETLIDFLSKVPALKVIGRSSSFSFKGKNEDLRTIGEKLGVSHVLEGSVQKDGKRVRITAQLIDVADGSQMYSDKFDRELKDIFSIQDEISLAILDAVKLKLIGNELKDVLKKYTENVEAYQLYLQGRFHTHKYSPEGFFKAIEYFEGAIAIDSNYAIAYSGLAFCYMNITSRNWAPVDQSRPKALQFASKALELDDEIAETHLNVGRIKLHFEYKTKEAEIELKKAIAINPNNAEVFIQLGFCAVLLGDNIAAVQYADKAVGLDPFSLLNLAYIGTIYWTAGDPERLLSIGKRLVEIEPDFYGGHRSLGFYNILSKRYREAMLEFEMAVELVPDFMNLSYLGISYGLLREKNKAQEIIEKMNSMEGVDKGGNVFVGLVYGGIGEWDTAFQYFEKAAENRESLLLWVKFHFRDLQMDMKDPRAQRLFEKMGQLYE